MGIYHPYIVRSIGVNMSAIDNVHRNPPFFLFLSTAPLVGRGTIACDGGGGLIFFFLFFPTKHLRPQPLSDPVRHGDGARRPFGPKIGFGQLQGLNRLSHLGKGAQPAFAFSASASSSAVGMRA